MITKADEAVTVWTVFQELKTTVIFLERTPAVLGGDQDWGENNYPVWEIQTMQIYGDSLIWHDLATQEKVY